LGNWRIDQSTRYWRSGAADWQPIGEIELSLRSSPNAGFTLQAQQEKPSYSSRDEEKIFERLRRSDSSKTVLSDRPEKSGCRRIFDGCLVVGCLAFVAVAVLGIVAAMYDGDPTSKVIVTGTTGKSHLEILSTYTPQLAGETVAEEVYKIASTYPQITEVDIELELSAPGGLVDTYGHAVSGPYIMGTLPINDLGDVRKYANASSYGIAVQDAYAIRIMGLDYANFLKKR
jgi:hypothetical protein